MTCCEHIYDVIPHVVSARDFANDYCFEEHGQTGSLPEAQAACDVIGMDLLNVKHEDEDAHFQNVVRVALGFG